MLRVGRLIGHAKGKSHHKLGCPNIPGRVAPPYPLHSLYDCVTKYKVKRIVETVEAKTATRRGFRKLKPSAPYGSESFHPSPFTNPSIQTALKCMYFAKVRHYAFVNIQDGNVRFRKFLVWYASGGRVSSIVERRVFVSAYQEHLADAVALAWRNVAAGREADAKEFEEEGRKRDVGRRREFAEAIKTARRFGVPWAWMVQRGVSKPTLYKYGKGVEE